MFRVFRRTAKGHAVKRLGLVIIALVFAGIVYEPAASQDNYEERIGSLETRVAVLESGGTGTPAAPVRAETYKISGVFTAYGDSSSLGLNSELPKRLQTEDSECFGFNGYDDLHLGTSVTVSDGEGNVIGVGEVRSSEVKSEASTSRSCAFKFVVEDLPRADFYAVEVSHRGAVTFSFDELEEEGWRIQLSIG